MPVADAFLVRGSKLPALQTPLLKSKPGRCASCLLTTTLGILVRCNWQRLRDVKGGLGQLVAEKNWKGIGCSGILSLNSADCFRCFLQPQRFW